MNRNVKIIRNNKEVEVDIASLTSDEMVQVLDRLKAESNITNESENRTIQQEKTAESFEKLESSLLKIEVQNKDLVDVECNLDKIIRNYNGALEPKILIKLAASNSKFRSKFNIPEELSNIDIIRAEIENNKLISTQVNESLNILNIKENEIMNNSPMIHDIISNSNSEIDSSYSLSSVEDVVDMKNDYLTFAKKSKNQFLNKTIISNNLLSNIIVDKYFYKTVEHKIKMDFNLFGIYLGNLTKYFNTVATLLEPLSKEILKELLSSDSCVLTESRFNTIEDDKMQGWLLCLSSPLNGDNKVYYMYNKNLDSQDFYYNLKDYNGLIQSDWARDYLIKDNNYNIAITFSYLRNLFEDELSNIDVENKNDNLKITVNKILRSIDRIIYIDKCGRILLENNNISEIEFLEKRKIESQIQLNKLLKILKARRVLHINNASLMSKIDFSIKNFSLFSKYLDKLETTPYKSGISNYIMMFNIEKLDKFYIESDNAAQNFATILSVLQSANANNIDMVKYLTYLLDTIKTDKFTCEKYRSLLPWHLNDEIKDQLQYSNKAYNIH